MMGIPIMNDVTDMKLHKCFDRVPHFIGSDSGSDRLPFVCNAVGKVTEIMNDLAWHRANTQTIRFDVVDETYDNRLNTIFQTCGF
jgi:hypothetical protein